MITILPPQGTLHKIDDALTRRPDKKRSYLGASELGYPCDRRVWYSYHMPEKREAIPPRVKRIFDMGHMIEEYVLDLLKDAGIIVWGEKPDGTQFGFKDDEIRGHADGIVKGIPESDQPHLLEIKSMNKSNFAKCEKRGIESEFYHYFIQMQIYMLKLELKNGLFISYCKDNSELYTERIKLDKMKAEFYLKRGKELVIENKTPDRKFKSSAYFECKFCPFKEECWK